MCRCKDNLEPGSTTIRLTCNRSPKSTHLVATPRPKNPRVRANFRTPWILQLGDQIPPFLGPSLRRHQNRVRRGRDSKIADANNRDPSVGMNEAIRAIVRDRRPCNTWPLW